MLKWTTEEDANSGFQDSSCRHSTTASSELPPRSQVGGKASTVGQERQCGMGPDAGASGARVHGRFPHRRLSAQSPVAPKPLKPRAPGVERSDSERAFPKAIDPIRSTRFGIEAHQAPEALRPQHGKPAARRPQPPVRQQGAWRHIRRGPQIQHVESAERPSAARATRWVGSSAIRRRGHTLAVRICFLWC